MEQPANIFNSLIASPSFWVAAGFVLFIVFASKPLSKLLFANLDKRSSEIKDQLDEALKLKEEAQAMLASYKIKQDEIKQEAAQIINQAEIESQKIIENSNKELEVILNKRVELAMQKISAYEASVVQEVKNNSVDIAISTVKSLVLDNINKDISEELISKAIADLDKKLH